MPRHDDRHSVSRPARQSASSLRRPRLRRPGASRAHRRRPGRGPRPKWYLGEPSPRAVDGPSAVVPDRRVSRGRRRDRVAQALERVEGAAAAATAHRAVRRAQGVGRHAEARPAFGTLGVHGPACARQSARRRPASSAQPSRVAVSADIKPRPVSGCHRVRPVRRAGRSARAHRPVAAPARSAAPARPADRPGCWPAARRRSPAPSPGSAVTIRRSGDAVAHGVVARGDQRLRVDVHARTGGGAELRARRSRGCRSRSRNRRRCRPARWRAPSSHSRHSAVVGCVPVPKARPGSSSMRIGVRVARRQAARADPEAPAEAHRAEVLEPLALPRLVRAASRSAVRGAAVGRPAQRVPRSRRGRRSASNSAFTVIVGHSGVAPGAGSSTGSSAASSSVTDTRAELEQRVLERLGIALGRCRW